MLPLRLLRRAHHPAMLTGEIEYSRMEGEGSSSSSASTHSDAVLSNGLPKKLGRLHRILKGAAQLHIFLGLATLALGALADYVATANGGLRVPAVPEVAALYAIVTGLVGVCGAGSLRRGLVTAFVVCAVHACLVFVPLLALSSAASLALAHRHCYLQNAPGSLNILCGSSATAAMEGNPDTLAAVAVDSRLEWGLLAMGFLQFAASAYAAYIGLLVLCESLGRVDHQTIQTIHKLTAYDRSEPLPSPPLSTRASNNVYA